MDQEGKSAGDERSSEERRLGSSGGRRDSDHWLRELIQELINAHHQRVRRITTSMAIGYLILMVGGMVGLYFLERNDNGQQDRASVASCKRVNDLRTQANEIAEASWATVYISARREERLAQAGPEVEKKVHKNSAAGLDYIASRFHHTDLTDCHKATFEADTYKPPRPESFDPTESQFLKDLIRLVGMPA